MYSPCYSCNRIPLDKLSFLFTNLWFSKFKMGKLCYVKEKISRKLIYIINDMMYRFWFCLCSRFCLKAWDAGGEQIFKKKRGRRNRYSPQSKLLTIWRNGCSVSYAIAVCGCFYRNCPLVIIGHGTIVQCDSIFCSPCNQSVRITANVSCITINSRIACCIVKVCCLTGGARTCRTRSDIADQLPWADLICFRHISVLQLHVVAVERAKEKFLRKITEIILQKSVLTMWMRKVSSFVR